MYPIIREILLTYTKILQLQRLYRKDSVRIPVIALALTKQVGSAERHSTNSSKSLHFSAFACGFALGSSHSHLTSLQVLHFFKNRIKNFFW